jgi:membrane associated rhomboid family serine protease
MGFLIVFIITVLVALLQMSLVYPLPFSDTGSVRYRTIPYATFALILINSVVFIAWQAPSYYRAETLPELQTYVDQIWMFGYRGVFMREGQSVGAFVTFTSMFMHADFFHLFGNMIYLWTFGRRVEDACGHWRFLLYYLGAGMVAAIGAELMNRARPDLPMIGASGAIAGVMGAYLVLFPGARVDCLWILGSLVRLPYAAVRGRQLWKWTIKVPAFILLIYFAVKELLPSIQTIQEGDALGGVSNLAHVMGFLSAILIFFYVRKDLLTRYFTGRAL